MKKIMMLVLSLVLALGYSCKKDNDKPVKKNKEVVEVKLDKITLSIVEGEIVQLIATVLPETAENKTLIWTSSEETIATVKDGLITAIKDGKVNITASSINNITVVCEVTVTKKAIALESILADVPITLTVGGTEKINLHFTPENATNKEVTYSSMTPSVAAVDENGIVTALAEGSSVITITSKENSSILTYCGVIVKEPKPDAIVPAELVGTWETTKLLTITYGVEYSEADMLNYCPQLEDQYKFNKTQFVFTFNDDDTIDLKFIDNDKKEHALKGALSLKDAEKKIYKASFDGTEDKDAKLNDIFLTADGFKMSLNSLSSADDMDNAFIFCFTKK